MGNFVKALGGILFFILFFGNKTQAQDPHFSQFYNAPMMLNPGVTGLLEGDTRAVLNYRTQWATIATPFQTMAASVDFNAFQEHTGKDVFGMGLVMMNDIAGSAGLQNASVGVSMAYHKSMNNKRNHFLSFGGRLSYAQQRLDFTKLTFDSQFDGNDLDPGITSGENIPISSLSYADIAAGISWSYSPKKGKMFYLGAAMDHLSQPQVSFFNSFGERLKTKITLYGGAEFKINGNVSLIPRAIYLSQGPAQEINFGGLVKFNVGSNRGAQDKTSIYFGTMHRLNDAQVIILRYDYNKIAFSFSYDANISKLTYATRGRGALEFAIIYNDNLFPDNRNKKIICPKF